MTACNIRWLLVAAIVLSCITWTASRHHYTHTASGHRTRHRRQGAGLFLSASYVIPGGDGNGWGEWGDVSPCSRTCGGGVASQKRICLQIGPDGPECTGGDTKYFSCMTQDCPAGSPDFRAAQCSEFNDKEFRGVKYEWVPYTKTPNPCELNCMPHGERFYYRHKAKVIDGTRCNDESYDVCVDGTCQPVGCDMMLGSNASEDQCRECRGHGASCRTYKGIFDDDKIQGYNDILLIPEGATTILIQEIAPSDNYLALRAKSGTYYLNGHYHIDFPRTLIIAGALWSYERSHQGFAAPDKLRCLGPTNETLYVSLLLQSKNVGIQYEYSVPNNTAPPSDRQYNWVYEDFEPCSAACGGGFQTRNVTCREREELDIVDDSLCDDGLKPPTNQSCNVEACAPQWVESSWGECSEKCGKDGNQTRTVECQKITVDGAVIIPEKECFGLHGAKPPLYQKCNEDAPCPKWFSGPWKNCDKLCGEGKQKRQVVCYQEINGRKKILKDEDCSDDKPETEKPCLLEPCDGVDWVVSEWIGCDSCLSKVKTRRIVCATKDREVYNESFCEYHKKPETERPCDEAKLPACTVQWYATQWSKCSVDCGKGIQSRKVFCGLFDGIRVKAVDDEQCNDQPKYNETKPCEIPKEDCPSKWHTGPWSACTKDCNEGEQYRRVLCFRDEVQADDCVENLMPAPTQACNKQPCTADVAITVNPDDDSVTDDDGLPYCDEDEEDAYAEIGLDEDLVTSSLMLSDSPMSFSELESTFTTESGSGDGTDTFSTEGSGAGTSFSTITDETDYDEDNSTKTTDASRGTESTPGETASTDDDFSSSIKEDELLTASTSETDKVPDEKLVKPPDDSDEFKLSTELSTDTDSTDVSGSTEDFSSTPTATDNTISTEEVSSTVDTTGSDVTSESASSDKTSVITITPPSDSTEDGNTTESGSSISTEEGSTVSTEEGSTISTEEGSTTESSTDSTENESTTEPSSTISTEKDSTTVSDSSASTEESSTTELGSTITSEEGSTTESGSTVSIEEETDSTENESTTGPSSTISTEEDSTTVSDSSASTKESSTTELGSTVSNEEGSTTESGSSVSTEEGSTTESGSTVSIEEESTTESGSTFSTEEGSTTESGSTISTEEISTTEAGSTISTEEASTTESGSTFSTEEGSTTESGSTISTESGSTISTEEGSTTELGSTFSTEEESTLSTEYSSTQETESTETGSTTESTKSSTTEESSTYESSTDEGVVTYTGTTPFDWSTPFLGGESTKAMCRPRKAKCESATFGCCSDKKTAASGPFDEGCPKSETCKQTKHGCCPDGVSPAHGSNNKGCPIENCAETLFGCCASDNKTSAQGNDQEGCPPPPPACTKSKFGCCADNETEATGPNKRGCPESETTTTFAETETSGTTEFETTTSGGTTETSKPGACLETDFGCCYDNETTASGPDGQGCPCNATEFGCCPDGVTPAQGDASEGCNESCHTSPHGCCADNETPAHGPNQEGCCLLTAFGCCPDNRKPAEGSHLEGCGCEHSIHGCCPDNVTNARGPDNQGCGCQYTAHGCCPDRRTEASGPNFEGCACSTYQFGCCDDGVTTAKGPDQQGCSCEYSKFGCCGDQKTHASGPAGAGCDCSSSLYGCCPDGQTEATGPKFNGCTNVPENKQAVCTLRTDPGPCHNYTAMWFYDMDYGGCSRFWFGGCEGNGNKFATKEECEDICVQPAPKDACNLPSVKGACDGDFIRWSYNSTREQCVPFRYSGCLGNSNNFETRELCQTQCEPVRIRDQCSLPIERGPCAGNFSHWGFNKESHRCEQFTWGGCQGNDNRFSSEIACQMRCGNAKVECTSPQEAGNCSSKQALWSFSQPENRCVPFYYTGCGGNDNRFESIEACESQCPSAYAPDRCTLPASTGNCSNYREMWFYDTSIKRCRQFYYGGCGGNENNFATEGECARACNEVAPTTTTTTTTVRPAAAPQPAPAGDRPEYCYYEIDAGPCTNMETAYAFDAALGHCKPFQYGGCGGNRNNFRDEEYCTYYCKAVQDICQLPMQTGPCDDSVMSWFYDAASDSCSQFTYGGCEGNGNRFDSREACEDKCRGHRVTVATTTVTTQAPPRIDTRIASGCEISPSPEPCIDAGMVWFLDPASGKCVAHINAEGGADCKYRGAFQTQEACERACGAFLGVENVCQQRVDPGPCQEYEPKIYFDQESGTCKEFTYGGCFGSPNRFSTYEECAQVCKPLIDVCSLPLEGGNCLGYFIQWHYDASRDSCHQFVYTGCSGNDNRFETQQDCEARCKKPSPVTTTTTSAPGPVQPSQCITPSSLVPCGDNVTAYYFDSDNRICVLGSIGNCGYPNTYRTEEECLRTCGNHTAAEVCISSLDPGPCRAAIPMYYWDMVSGSCQQFMYGGCGGGPNRFSSAEECENYCGPFRLAPACHQPLSSGSTCDVRASYRWHYSAQDFDCRAFVYLGCGGNDNNFRTQEECNNTCVTPYLSGASCDDLDEECRSIQCEHGLLTESTPQGCLRCICAPPNCDAFKQECEALQCSYGVVKTQQQGCERCSCANDPCASANCPTQRCVAVAYRDSVTREARYYANCLPDEPQGNCDRYKAECESLRCEFGIQKLRTADNCERCSCVPRDCSALQQDCDALECEYGVQRTNDTDGCPRCNCYNNPCTVVSCGPGERCALLRYNNALDNEPHYSTECRPVNKPGYCPVDNDIVSDESCSPECSDDADCRGDGKCCSSGCGATCLLPDPEPALLTTTRAPLGIPAPPMPLPPPEPQVTVSEGDKATLRCLFQGNPPPKITWRRGEILIDSSRERYRLTSDGALEIVSLKRTDAGVYICIADNGLGSAMQEISLVVNDPVNIPAGIVGDENAAVTGELDSPLEVACLAYGYPEPGIYWYRSDGSLVPINDAVFRARKNTLLIKHLSLENLGPYTCQAYNANGKAASWVVTIQAYRPEGFYSDNSYLVSRHHAPALVQTRPPMTREIITTSTTTTARIFTVPVSANLTYAKNTLNVGEELRLTCELDGFPEPQSTWTKDGVQIVPNDRITISDSSIVSRLTVSRLEVSDSGQYACHARNEYNSASDYFVLRVQQLARIPVPAKCTDNPFFANCKLIVRSKFCVHKYYSKICCKSCVEAGQLDPQDAELQADQPFRRK